MQYVYVVTSMGIPIAKAIFTDREKAFELISEGKGTFNKKIQKFQLNPLLSSFSSILVRMDIGGKVIETKKVFDRHSGFFVYNRIDDKEIVWIVKTTDIEEAIQITNEKRLQILAAGCWGDSSKTSYLFDN